MLLWLVNVGLAASATEAPPEVAMRTQFKIRMPPQSRTMLLPRNDRTIKVPPNRRKTDL